MGLNAYLSQRQVGSPLRQTDAAETHRFIMAERRTAQELLDNVLAEQFAEEDPGRRAVMEGVVQTLGALVRELERSAKSLHSCLRSMRQLDQEDAKLARFASEVTLEVPSVETPDSGLAPI